MFRNIVLTSIAVGILTACSQGPDFSNPGVVVSKILYNEKAEYHLDISNVGVRGEGNGSIIFFAPNSFANVGDTIVYKDGAIVVDR